MCVKTMACTTRFLPAGSVVSVSSRGPLPAYSFVKIIGQPGLHRVRARVNYEVLAARAAVLIEPRLGNSACTSPMRWQSRRARGTPTPPAGAPPRTPPASSMVVAMRLDGVLRTRTALKRVQAAGV